MSTADPAPIPPRREIITDYFPPSGGTVRAFDQAPAEGDIHHATTVAIAVTQTKAERQALDVQIEKLQDEIGFTRMDDLLSRVAALDAAVRREAIARLIAAATDTFDFPIALFVVTGIDDDGGDA